MPAAGEDLSIGKPPRFNPPRTENIKRLMAYIVDYEHELARYLEKTMGMIQAFQENETQADANRAWTISNDQTDRTYDANTVTTAELADAHATLVHDLEDKGIIP